MEYWYGDRGHLLTCFMHKTTVIDEPSVEISSRDESVKALEFVRNAGIWYLPIDTYKKFRISLCIPLTSSIKSVRKENFHNLQYLKQLSLGKNRIKKIDGNLFEGLVSLDYILLGKKFDEIENCRNLCFSIVQIIIRYVKWMVLLSSICADWKPCNWKGIDASTSGSTAKTKLLN